jgi:hypothetical protein
MTKDSIIREAQHLCDSPMSSDAVNRYGAWKGVDTLVEKGLVDRDARSRDFRGQGGWGKAKDRFRITDAGAKVAEGLGGYVRAKRASRREEEPERTIYGSRSGLRWGLHEQSECDGGALLRRKRAAERASERAK